MFFIPELFFGAASNRSQSLLYTLLPKPRLEPRYRKYLVQYFRLYNKLDAKEKKKFGKRVQQFIDIKTFYPRSKGMKITDEMKAVIAGTAVLVTYGFPKVFLSHFWRILVYNNNYYSTITRQYHKGEVNPGGLIVLSWADLKGGMNNSKDGINLGIHEMAHALRIENFIRNAEYRFLNKSALRDIDTIANDFILKSSKGVIICNALREYSITNKQEFFAVASEVFLEIPEALHSSDKNLYYILCRIYRFDPLKIMGGEK